MDHIMTDTLNLTALIRDAALTGGGTYRIRFDGYGFYGKSMHFTSGYMVSKPNGVENVPAVAVSVSFLKAIIEAFDYQYALSLDSANTYLGIWVDDKGNWSIDVSECIDTEAAAYEIAYDRSQRAIWDNANGRAIDL
jgi:hypothetical protein